MLVIFIGRGQRNNYVIFVAMRLKKAVKKISIFKFLRRDLPK